MQYTVNTKRRLYVAENKFSIVLYKKMMITVNKISKSISIDLEDKKVFNKKLTKNVYKAIKKDLGCLVLAVSSELLLDEYFEEVLRIITKNSSYIKDVFEQLM